MTFKQDLVLQQIKFLQTQEGLAQGLNVLFESCLHNYSRGPNSVSIRKRYVTKLGFGMVKSLKT